MKKGKLTRIERQYPNFRSVFQKGSAPIATVASSAAIVLDTNALLLPYTVSSENLEHIKVLYLDLCKEDRLFIPAQVAREFARNRPKKITTLHHQLEKKASADLKVQVSKYPILESTEEFKKFKTEEDKLKSQIASYRKAARSLIEVIERWQWDDPVSSMYREAFEDSVYIEPDANSEQELEVELAQRYEDNIPPGYKDQSNPDGGVGDFIIWRTILKLAKDGHDVIFVTGDEKADWYHRGSSKALFPRYELLQEFRQHKPDGNFYIVPLSGLLKIMDVDQALVDIIKVYEDISPGERDILRNMSRYEVFEVLYPNMYSLYEVASNFINWHDHEDEETYVLPKSIRSSVEKFATSELPKLKRINRQNTEAVSIAEAILHQSELANDYSGTIGFEQVRMKRDTREEEIGLMAACKKISEHYEEFLKIATVPGLT